MTTNHMTHVEKAAFVNGIYIYYEVRGLRERTPRVLLHGRFDDRLQLRTRDRRAVS